jgi:hypothetical protein
VESWEAGSKRVEGRKEGGKEGRREGGKKGRREGGKEGGKKGRREEGGKEGRKREGGKKGRREGGENNTIFINYNEARVGNVLSLVLVVEEGGGIPNDVFA